MMLENPKPTKTSKITRTIFHIDFDAFFASVEQQDHPELRGKPIGVTGSSLTKGIITAPSREAKKFGVKTAMPVFKAKLLCPHLITVKGDFSRYQEIHLKTKEILETFSDLVEAFSIDEFFIDMTKTIKFFGSPEETIHKLKTEIFNAFGAYITCSIGVAENKLMAKLSSDINKPNGFFIVTPENLNQLLENTKLTDFCGIGPRIEKRLNKIGIFTVRQLQQISHEALYKEFGNIESGFLKSLSFGLGSTVVSHSEYKSAPKSIGHQHTLSKNTQNPTVIKRNLQRLCAMVGRRLRSQKMVGKTVSLYLRDKDFRSISEQKSLTVPTDSTSKIYEVIIEIYEKTKWNRETRLVGVSISNLSLKSKTTLPLFLEDRKREFIDEAIDKINDKFGDYTIIPANTVLADQTEGKISSFLRH